MAVLKMGSKGKDVEKLQARLNQLKSSPKLDVDGDFGKETQKSVIYFQKKIAGFEGKGVDGVVGEWTQSALDWGKAMPKPPKIDVKADAPARDAKQQQFNARFTHLLAQVEGAADKFAKDIGTYVPMARNMVKNNAPNWEEMIKSATQIENKISEFEAKVKKNPGAAEKLGKEIEALNKAYKDAYQKVEKEAAKMEAELDAIGAKIEAGLATIGKTVKEYRKHMK